MVEDKAVEIIALGFDHRYASAVPRDWNPFRVLKGNARGGPERFMGIIRPTMYSTHARKDDILCRAYLLLRQQSV